MTNRLISLIVFLGLLLPITGFAQLDRSEEISQLMAGLESTSQVQRINSAKLITRSGLQDQALYQKVADLLRAGYSREYEKEHADEMSWMCKALAASGDLKYRELLDEVAANAPSVKVKRYAKESSELIDTYAQRIKILNATDNWDEELSSEENRLVNMLESDDVSLKRDAAKIITRNSKNNEKVFTAAATALSDMSKDFRSDNPNGRFVDDDEQDLSEVPKGSPLSRLQIDTMSWLCKALAVSGDDKYINVLEHIQGNTQSGKLRSYASKALKSLN